MNMNYLKSKNLSQISFPALGTGGFAYPFDLVAQVTLNSLSSILKGESMNNNFYKVNIVVYERDYQTIQVKFTSHFFLSIKFIFIVFIRSLKKNLTHLM